LGKSFYRGRKAINVPLTGRNRRQRKGCVEFRGRIGRGRCVE
jgi:hypothetical protein